MRPTFRKLEVKDIGSLERLIAENVEGVEPGLKVVDSRLVLGQASVDLVGLDATDSLVLIAFDFSADDGLLLRVMDAYSWCLEYPDTFRRLYPMAQASSRPPRILFIVEKVTDAFLRRIKQLSFLEIDCFEFRNLEVNGASVMYFDHIERIRKEAAVGAPAPAVAAPVAAPAVEARVEARVESRIEPRVEPRAEAHVEPVKPAIEWRTHVASPEAEPKQVDPPRAVVVVPVRSEPAPVAVTAPGPVAPVAVTVPEPVAPVAVIAPEPIAPVAVTAPEPIAPAAVIAPERVASVAPVVLVESAPTPVVEQPSVVVEARALPVEQNAAPVAEAAAVPPAPAPVAVTPAERALQLEAIEATSVRAHTNGHAHEQRPVAPVVEAASRIVAPVEIAAPTPVVAVTPQAPPALVLPVEPAPAPVQPPPAQPSPVWAKPGSQANGTRPHFFAHATKSTTPVEAPAMAAAMAAPAEPATPPAASKVGLEVDDRPELESLSFPKDGLSRQWLEFLSQLGATK